MTASTTARQSARTSIGVVDRARNPKTRRVVVQFQQRHPKYGKFVGSRTIVYAHDEKNESRVGDKVEIAPCRPMSATKRFTLVRIVEKAPAEG